MRRNPIWALCFPAGQIATKCREVTDMLWCTVCGQPLSSENQYHTYEACLLYKLNDYRVKVLGKQPIEVDIEAEDKAKEIATPSN